MWVAAVRIDNGWTPSELSSICSKHFRASDYWEGNKIKRLKDGAIPSVFDFVPLQTTTEQSVEVELLQPREINYNKNAKTVLSSPDSIVVRIKFQVFFYF